MNILHIEVWLNQICDTVTKTSFDMDPFAIVSFGQKIFRTRVVRHSLNPVWDEKLLFHVRRHEAGFKAKFAVYDWDRMSSHDFVGGAEIDVAKLIDLAPKPDPQGLYTGQLGDEGSSAVTQDMKKFVLPLDRLGVDSSELKGAGKGTITVQAKFQPYDLLRQRFWWHLLQQFDTNDSGSLSELELTNMLESLGSTLSSATIASWFEKCGKPFDDELTYDEAVLALEAEIKKPFDQKRKVKVDVSAERSGSATPALAELDSSLQSMNVSGTDAPAESERVLAKKNAVTPASALNPEEHSATNPPSQQPLLADAASAALGIEASRDGSDRLLPPKPPQRSASMLSEADSDVGTGASGQVEQVIKLKSCPLCHMPRLNRKGEVDIVTHLAVCASQDWRRLDSMVVRNYVTASQAHRKWYTKVFTKISQGSYSLGANSANIIVQDRLSGELMEEKMQVYVRLGIRLLYQGMRARTEGARVKRMLKNMSVKQGEKFEDPASVRDIAPFIAFHKLNVNEIRDPIDSFKNFNQFFYRKLKPDARPVSSPDDPTVLVSGADCRMMAFDKVEDATRIWIKGRGFSVEQLLGPSYKDQVDSYRGGALCIFRLAPQDYHRFHCPADALVAKITELEGELFTVNPMAIRSAIDVYGTNARAVVEFHSPQFGRFFAVCIGAMMVGSWEFTVKVGDFVKRGDEFGFFKFGGSTIVCL